MIDHVSLGSTTYFGAMFLDLDGHRIEVTTNAA